MKWCVQSQVGQAGGWSAKACDGARWMFGGRRLVQISGVQFAMPPTSTGHQLRPC
jgi:hypothetical protein